jgi:transposase
MRFRAKYTDGLTTYRPVQISQAGAFIFDLYQEYSSEGMGLLSATLINLQVLNAILYVTEHGCKWRGLPMRFGNWYSIYTRMNRWAKSGVLDRVLSERQHQQIICIRVEAVSLDSTAVKVHPDGTGDLKTTVRKLSASLEQDGPPRFIMVAADARTAVSFSLSPGNAGDAPDGRELLKQTTLSARYVVMDRAYKGDETRQLVFDLGLTPVAPPKSNRIEPYKH